MSSDQYLIVFDTNVLYVPYESKADFTKFYFNSTFNNILDKIEELDLYNYVQVGIPTVVWEEMKKQKCSAYVKKLHDLELKINKFKFPFHRFTQETDKVDYSDYLEEEVKKFREIIKKRQVKVIDIMLPSNIRFDSIVKRAFEKRPPFEGSEGGSDKGFKDALLWESILEYNSIHQELNMILYSSDKLFCDELIHEFKSECQTSEIKIFGKNQESGLIEELESIALNIDSFSYVDVIIDDIDKARNWVYSESFLNQILNFQDRLEEVNKFTVVKKAQIGEINDIDLINTNDDEVKDFCINSTINFTLSVLDKAEVEVTHNIVVYAVIQENSSFEIDDIEIVIGGEEDEVV